MAQYNFGNLESPLSGSVFINTHLEPWRDALHSTHSGIARPSYVVTGMIWLKTTTKELFLFDGADDILIGTFDFTGNTFTPANVTPAANSIANSQLANMAGNTVKGNINASASAPSDISLTASTILARLATGNIVAATITQILDLIAGSAVQGDILFRGASAWERLAAGTSGYKLQTNGAGANPSWSASSQFSEFRSLPTTLTSGVTSSGIAHGLAGVPKELFVYLVCTSASAGYSVGDIVPMAAWSEAGISRGVGITADATNIYFIPAAGGTNFLNKSTAGFAGVDLTKFDAIGVARY